MGFYGMTKETLQESKKAKEKEAQQKLAKMEEEAKTGKTINKILIEQKFGQPVYFAKGVESDLWVYDTFVIIERNKSKVLNAFNHTVKCIPYKSVKTLQFKNSGLFVPNIEFGVSGYDSAIKESAPSGMDNENLFSFSDTLEHSNASDIYFFILDKILKN